MGTTIVNPSGGGPSMSSIDQAFSNIYSMFGSPSASAGGSGPFGISPEPVSGSDNSLTAFWRGLSNLLGTSGANLLGTGTGLLSTGTGVTQGGLDVSQTGLDTLQPSIDFYNKILSGDPTATTAALAPTASNIASITSGATNNASQGLPAGGYRAATLAGLPFAQAAQVGNAALALQPQAAQALSQLGGEQAQIGQGISSTGLGLGQLGTALTGQGTQSMQNVIADILSKMGINITGGTTNTFNTWTQSLANLI